MGHGREEMMAKMKTLADKLMPYMPRVGPVDMRDRSGHAVRAFAFDDTYYVYPNYVRRRTIGGDKAVQMLAVDEVLEDGSFRALDDPARGFTVDQAIETILVGLFRFQVQHELENMGIEEDIEQRADEAILAAEEDAEGDREKSSARTTWCAPSAGTPS